MIKFIVSHLDRNLLQNEARTIAELSQKNTLFVIASGRQYGNLRRLFRAVADQISYICENGALVVHHNQIILKQSIPREIGIKLIEQILDCDGCEVFISGENISYLIPKTEDYLIYIRDELMNHVHVIKILEEIGEEFLKISLYRPQGISSQLKDSFVDQFQRQLKIAVAGNNWLYFTNLRTNKGEAIKVFQQYLSLLPDEMMGFWVRQMI